MNKELIIKKVKKAAGINFEMQQAKMDLQVWNETVAQKAMGQIIPVGEYEERRLAAVKAHNLLRSLNGKPPRDNQNTM